LFAIILKLTNEHVHFTNHTKISSGYISYTTVQMQTCASLLMCNWPILCAYHQ